jgi:hypothetical protein
MMDKDVVDSSSEQSIRYGEDITVVIATIGEKSLAATVDSIISGSVVPLKILLCIPNKIATRVSYLSTAYECVEVLPTAQKGQVIQRILGFQRSNTKYTLQLDADVIVDRYLVENLANALEFNPRSCVGPVIYRNDTKKIYSFLSANCIMYHGYQKKIITWILNGTDGYESGLISRGGIGFGPDLAGGDTEVQWLPGCCIMHKTTNLILENFYSQQGKAYAEDLYHSHYIRQKGVKMMYDKASKVHVSFPETRLIDVISIFKMQYASYKALLGLVKLTGKSAIRLSLYVILNMSFLFINKIFH